MKRESGFTLIELLVVIAIIAILAGIVIPNVPTYINKARGTRAFAEVKNIELAMIKMLTDVNRSDFRGFFMNPPVDLSFCEAQAIYQQAFYILLRQGRNAETTSDWGVTGLQLNQEVRRRLGTTYMDLGKDPWGQLYYIYPGPYGVAFGCDASNPCWVDVEGTGLLTRIPFRIHFVDTSVPGSAPNDGAGATDSEGDRVGLPASRSLSVYVFSSGMNQVPNQGCSPGYNDSSFGDDFVGGGDDINNWDTDQSWAKFYN
jgi:prepilin-type N-terminal cleavage/methylation domain-containing protein